MVRCARRSLVFFFRLGCNFIAVFGDGLVLLFGMCHFRFQHQIDVLRRPMVFVVRLDGRTVRAAAHLGNEILPVVAVLRLVAVVRLVDEVAALIAKINFPHADDAGKRDLGILPVALRAPPGIVIVVGAVVPKGTDEFSVDQRPCVRP